MLNAPLPDLASALRLQSQSQTVRANLEQASQELTTGLTADVRGLTNGNLAPVFNIDRELAGIDLVLQDLGLAGARAASAQTALGVVAERGNTLGVEIMDAASRGDPISRDSLLNTAPGILHNMVGSLNTQFAGQSLFSGTETGVAPLASADQIIAEVSALLATATTPAAAQAAIDTYFDTPGGGFQTNIYAGSDTDAAGVALDADNRLTYLPRADDPAIRNALKAVATIAAADAAGFSGDDVAYNAFLVEAGNDLQKAAEGVIGVRATLGQAEERIANASESRSIERTTLITARNDLIGVDQFDAAARLSELETQLESLYLVTGRLSGLNLTNFLR
ncbi:MAG: flagellin [Pseudomonadota bacterium]